MSFAKLHRSSALRSACAFALGGGGFALANVVLARGMAPRDYGVIVLFIAFTQLGATLGSAGMDTVTVRHRIGPSAHLFMRVLTSATAFGGLCALGMIAFMGISIEFACLLIFAMVFSSLNRLGCSFLQSLEHYRRGLGVMLAHNGTLLAAALLAFVTEDYRIETLAVIMTVGYVITAGYGWQVGHRQLAAHALRDSVGSHGREAFAIVASQTSVAVLNQLDRLLIPRLVSTGALGQYAAASTLCTSPFNLLQSGARYSLLPRLRNSKTRLDALRLIRSEALASLALMVIAGIGCLLLAPAVSEWLFAGRYTLEQDLLELLIVLGFLKVWDSYASSCVQALGTHRSLTFLSIAGWVALAVAIAGSFAAEDPQLTDVVTAIVVGWLTLCLAGTAIATHAALTSETDEVSKLA